MTIDEMIAVLQAAKSGKRVEFIEVGNGRFWCEFSDTKDFSAWNFSKYKYRVKPEPREWTGWVGWNGKFYGGGIPSGEHQVKVREVLE